jgi:DNA-binding beta-propeller fold protein YncE
MYNAKWAVNACYSFCVLFSIHPAIFGSKELPMKSYLIGLSVLVCLFSSGMIQAQTSVFTYQGHLSDGVMPANGTYQMRFSLWDAANGSGQVGSTIIDNTVTLANGVFTVQLDFTAPNAFDGSPRFLEIAVRKASDPPGFTTLTPRQALTSSPYSIRTLSASSADSLSLLCNPCVSDGQIVDISGGKVTGAVANATTAGNVTGIVQVANGGTGSATQNFVDLSTNQAGIAGNKSFTGAVGVTGGSGVFNGNGSGLTNLNGASIAPNSIPQTAVQGGAIALNPQKLALHRFYDLNKALPSIPIINSPQAITFDGAFIYVAHRDPIPGFSDYVSVIRASTGAVEGAIDVGENPVALAFDGTFVYVANQNSDNVTRFKAGSTSPPPASTQIAVGDVPAALVFDGTFVYVANSNGDNITRIRASTGVVEGAPIPVGDRPIALAFDGTFIYVANQGNNNVSRIRASTGLVEGTPVTFNFPQALAFDGTFIYIAHANNKVSRIRASTGSAEGSPITVGDDAVALEFDGTFVYVVNKDDDNITRIRAATGLVEGAPIPVGIDPVAIAFDGLNIYVANSGSNTVSRF